MNESTDISLLAELRKAQREHGWLSPEVIAELAGRQGVSESHLSGVASFYSLLHMRPRGRFVIRVCESVSCHLGGVDGLLRLARELLGISPGDTTADGMFSLETVGCLGACGSGPAAMIDDRLYTHLDAERFAGLIAEIRGGQVPPADRGIGVEQVRAIGEPVLIGGSIPAAGELLARFTPEELLTELEASGLRGRGGAAFSTGRKWRICSEAAGDQKFIVCNADEGEPGTFKDRYLLTEHPDWLIAGMVLAGHAVGAGRGYIYLRGEYPDAQEALEREIARISHLSFGIELVIGAGAYICGEETALLESIEGRRGVPRLRPPYPPVSGLFGKPTVINNVETLASVPLIVARGASWHKTLGTEQSPGTKLFSVSGDVGRPGIIESPLGTPLDVILSEAGAGELKAVLVGGTSGRLVPARDFGRRLCYEDLSPGAGAIIAIGKNRSVRELVANLMAFFEQESCGECVPCRIGTVRAREILSGGRDTEQPIVEVLRSLGEALADSSRCGLGQTAPIALLDALAAFPEEFEA